MAGGVDNLVPFTSDQDREQARINGAKGGRKSGESRRRRKAMSEAFDILLSKHYVDREGRDVEGVDALCARVFQGAMDGDLSAARFIRDTIGEMPVQRIETVEIPQEVYDDVRKALSGEE